MNLQYIQFIISGLFVLIPAIVFIGVLKTQWDLLKQNSNDGTKKLILNILEDETDDKDIAMLQENKGYFSVDYLDKYLSTHGGYFMFDWLNPSTFLIIKFVASLLFFIVCLTAAPSFGLSKLMGFGLAIVLGIVGFYVFDFTINFVNNEDNSEMLDDIRIIFDVLRIESRAGVFLSDSLQECFLLVKHERLKTALLDMSNKIALTNDIDGAISEFGNKFSNQYIDTLCITLQQAQKSGKSLKLLEDISKQIDYIQVAINLKEKEKAETKSSIFSLLIFVAMIIVLAYCMFKEMGSALGDF